MHELTFHGSEMVPAKTKESKFKDFKTYIFFLHRPQKGSDKMKVI